MARARRMTVQDWRAGYGVVDPRNKEVISGTLWHRRTYTSASTRRLTFFDQVPTAINLGNMETVTLPNGWSFLVQAMRVAILAPTVETAVAVPAAGVTNTAIDDVQAITYNGVVEAKVGSKSYGKWLATMLPAGCGPYGFLSVPGSFITSDKTAQHSFAVNGFPDVRNVYSLGIPFVIPPLYPFVLSIDWAAPLTLFGGDTDILVMYDGEVMRPRQ